MVRLEHSVLGRLKAKLEEYKSSPGKHLLVTDGVFSMDGDIAKLPEIVEICEKYGVIVVVDDAHGEGVLGRGGRGIVDHFGLHGKVDVEVGTMSKAFGVMGGVIAGSTTLIDYIRQKARPNLFSSALTVPDVAANLASVEILEESDELVTKLRGNGDFLKKELSAIGFNTGNSETPITPVIIGEAQEAKTFSAKLFDNGVFATAIVFPTVPRGTARIRCMVSAAHSKMTWSLQWRNSPRSAERWGSYNEAHNSDSSNGQIGVELVPYLRGIYGAENVLATARRKVPVRYPREAPSRSSRFATARNSRS